MSRAVDWRDQLLDAWIFHLGPRHSIGLIYDRRAEDGLRILKREKEVAGWQFTRRHREDDKKGRDIWVRTTAGEKFPFQITSTPHKARYRKTKHPDVFVIHIRRSDYPRDKELKSPREVARNFRDGFDFYRRRQIRR